MDFDGLDNFASKVHKLISTDILFDAVLAIPHKPYIITYYVANLFIFRLIVLNR